MTDDPRTLAIVREYDDLIAAVRARMDELENDVRYPGLPQRRAGWL